MEGAKSAFIGAAVYPTLALFNHSCDPSIVRYYVRDHVVVQVNMTVIVYRANDYFTVYAHIYLIQNLLRCSIVRYYVKDHVVVQVNMTVLMYQTLLLHMTV